MRGINTLLIIFEFLGNKFMISKKNKINFNLNLLQRELNKWRECPQLHSSRSLLIFCTVWFNTNDNGDNNGIILTSVVVSNSWPFKCITWLLQCSNTIVVQSSHGHHFSQPCRRLFYFCRPPIDYLWTKLIQIILIQKVFGECACVLTSQQFWKQDII